MSNRSPKSKRHQNRTATRVLVVFFTLFLVDKVTYEIQKYLNFMEIQTVRMIIVSYPRSGSTYTGDLLTAASNSVYFFEPFTEDRQNYFTPWEEILVNQTRDKIEGMLFCNNDTLATIQSRPGAQKDKNSTNCLFSKRLYLKEIRLHHPNLEPWINETDYKVLHLVRDPRAIMFSIENHLEKWPDFVRNSSVLCQTIQDDFSLQHLLPQNQYALMRFEDLIDFPTRTLLDVYGKLEVALDTPVLDFLKSQAASKKYKQTPNIHRWKTDMSKDKISEIQKNCEEVLKKAGYTLMK